LRAKIDRGVVGDVGVALEVLPPRELHPAAEGVRGAAVVAPGERAVAHLTELQQREKDRAGLLGVERLDLHRQRALLGLQRRAVQRHAHRRGHAVAEHVEDQRVRDAPAPGAALGGAHPSPGVERGEERLLDGRAEHPGGLGGVALAQHGDAGEQPSRAGAHALDAVGR
jgi:hypothetical protein